MCGIAGIVSRNQPQQETIHAMTSALAHRGPDADGYYLQGPVALGHRRLSIIDLDSRSNQPFFSQNKRYVIVYNGEIYNFKTVAAELQAEGFQQRTSSDTEILLEAFVRWGPEFIHKLNGIFAFAIYDIAEEKLFLFRDRVGKKPLYYYCSDTIFLFASELKSILKHPEVSGREVDRSTISTFMQLGYIPEPKTFYKDIKKFPAGHYAFLTRDFKFSLFSYWSVSNYITANRNISEPQAFAQLKELVTNAVHSRLVADVPVGIFLSGGIDSSLVTAVASKAARLKSFSIGFKESKYDESVYAQNVAKHLGTDHLSYLLKESEAVEMVSEYLDHFDEPFADTSSIPTMLVSRLAKKEVTVALTGDGGDEIFLGYGAYTWANRLGNPLWSVFRPLLHEALKLAPSSRWKRASHLFEKVSLEKKRMHIFSQEQYFFSDAEVKQKLLRESNEYEDLVYDDFPHLAMLSEAERQALFDFQFYLRDDLLVKVDRASMRYGLECRSPLLDHQLVEFAINLPESFRKKRGVSKYFLRKMLYEMVPEKYFNRPKWGFSIPLGKWMRNELSWLMRYITEEELIKTGVFNTSYVKYLVERFNNGEEYLYNRLWVVIIIQRFLLRNSGQ